MSILIKGMDMPKDGGLLCVNIYPDGKVCINLDLDCKRIATAFPVPPHGRLIDANKIGLTDFEIILCQKKKGNPFKNALEILLEKIESAPNIIQAEEDDDD